MKVLITGATGLVGQAIVSVLHEEGMQVNYLTTRKNQIRKEEDYQGYLWNPAKGEIDLDCFDGVKAIINLAGASIAEKWTSAHKRAVVRSRVDSLNTLRKGLEQIKNTQIESFVSASAIGIYPSSLTDYYEESHSGIDDSFLGEVVEVWEKAAKDFSTFSFPVALIRIGIVLSTEGGALPKMDAPIRNYAGAPIGSGEQWQSWIHIDDLARMFVFTLKNQLSGIYNGVGPNPVTNSKMTKTIAKSLKKPLLLPNVPAAALKLFLGEMAYIVLASQRVSSKKMEDEGFVFEYSNLDCALEALYYPKVALNSAEMSRINKEYV
ncbi:MAG: TIGR01777 family oxidoreductase [Bacteroidota bacterium]